MKLPSVCQTIATWLVLATIATPHAHAAITHDWPADGDATDTVGDADGTLVGVLATADVEAALTR